MAAAKNTEKTTTTEIAIPELTSEEYRNLKVWDDVISLIADKYNGQVVDAAEDLGDGFTVLKDKDKLIDAPMYILSWDFHDGDMGEFIAARVVANTTRGMRKYVVIDGSTGLYKQMKEHTELNGSNRIPIRVNRGLRRSDYEVDIEDPKTGETKRTPASTYYLNTEAEE